MLHKKIPLRAQRERSDRRVGTQKPLIVTVVRDTIRTVGIIVHEAKIKRRVGGGFGALAEFIKATWDRPWSAGFVTVFWDRFGGRGIDEGAGGGEFGSGVNAEDGCAAGGQWLENSCAENTYYLGVWI